MATTSPYLVLDGVFAESEPDGLRFHPAPPPSEDVARLPTTVRTRVRRPLARRGLEPHDAGVTPPRSARGGANLLVHTEDRARLEQLCR